MKMKNKRIKGILSVILCVLMLTLSPLSVFGATVATASGAPPVIYIPDMWDIPLFADPNTAIQQQLYPPQIVGGWGAMFFEYLAIYAAGIAQGEYTAVTNAIFPKLLDWWRPIMCNPDGTSYSNNVGPAHMNGYPMSAYNHNPEKTQLIAGDIGRMLAEELGADRVYPFIYDWRLSPLGHAKELNEIIEQVKEQTGSKKVTIVSNGTGSIVGSCYLNMFASNNNYSDIKNYVTLNSAALGVTWWGDIFTAAIDIDPNGLVRYVNEVSDNIITAPIIYLVNHILRGEWAHYEVALKTDLYIIHQKYNIYEIFLRPMLGYMPGLWALVPGDYSAVNVLSRPSWRNILGGEKKSVIMSTFSEALDIMYSGDFIIDPKLETDIKTYNVIQREALDIMQDMQKSGVNVYVVSAYGLQTPPMTDWATTETSDGLYDTRFTSFGAETAALNDDWVGRPLVRQIVKDGHDHTNAKRTSTRGFTVDASTCALPENTWFIYGMKHNTWDYNSDSQYYFLMWLINSDKERTVHDTVYYPQFMEFNRMTNPGNLWGRSTTDILRFNKMGDCDLDGEVTAADARLALRHSSRLVTLTRKAFRNGDLNGDGEITAAEARMILRVSSRLTTFAQLKKDGLI